MAEITGDKLDWVYQEILTKRKQWKENRAYVMGKNPEIHKEERKKDPDNRIPIPFAKMAVDDLTGYAARPGDISIYFDNVQVEDEDYENDPYNQRWREWAEHNRDEIEVSELFQNVLGYGKSYEIWWTEGGDGESPIVPNWKRVPGDTVYIEKTKDLRPQKVAAYYCREYGSGDEHKKVVDVLYPLYSEQWVYVSNKGKWERNRDGDMRYPYTEVPVIEYTGNMYNTPLFEAEKRLIDALDRLISSSSNEIDRFNALIALFPGKVTKEFVNKLKEMKVLDQLEEWPGDQWPRYLEKSLENVNDFYNNLADRLERLFHKSIKVPDFSSESFGTSDESGVARAYKLLGLEFTASMIETYFSTALQERKRLLDDVINASSFSAIPTEDYKMVISWKRNLPVDERAKAEIAMQLKGIISDESLLKMLPKTIIDDVEKELARLEEQRANNPLLNEEEMEENNE